MIKERRISFEEFRAHLQQVFERVVRDRETVVIETADAEAVTLQPGEPLDDDSWTPRIKTAEDYEAFLRTGGSWADLDVDDFLNKIYASRDQASRPPVEL